MIRGFVLVAALCASVSAANAQTFLENYEGVATALRRCLDAETQPARIEALRDMTGHARSMAQLARPLSPEAAEQREAMTTTTSAMSACTDLAYPD